MVIEITPKVNLFCLIAAIGAVMTIGGVFLSWVDLSGVTSGSLMGWDISTNSAYSNTSFGYVPMVSLACGIISLALMVLCIMEVDKRWDNTMNIAGVGISVIALILILLFNNDIGTSFGTDMINAATGMGLWVALAGCIVTAAGGIISTMKGLS